jgi:hypothetical protein
LFALFISISCQAQQYYGDTVVIRYNTSNTDTPKYKTDTLLFPGHLERNIVWGTMVWPDGPGQFMAHYYHGLSLEKAINSNCMGQSEELSLPRGITDMKITDSTWVFKVNVEANCCHSFLCTINADKKSTLELDYIEYGNHCDCECWFELTYTVKRIDLEQSKDIKYVQMKEDRKNRKKI